MIPAKYQHLFRRVLLDRYYPPFKERLIEAKIKAADRGHWFYSQYGFRTWGEQHQLRLNYLSGKGGRAAPAGLSAHNYGLADDSVFDLDATKPGLQPGWKPEQYAVLGEEAQRVGLVWGASFNDHPHVQWPGFVSGYDLRVLEKMWNSTDTHDTGLRLRATWAYLDSLPIPPRGA